MTVSMQPEFPLEEEALILRAAVAPKASAANFASLGDVQ